MYKISHALSALAVVGCLANAPAAWAQTIAPSNDNTGSVYMSFGGGIQRGWHNYPITTGDTGSNPFRGFITFAVPSSTNPYLSGVLTLGAATVDDGPNTLEVFQVTDPNTNDAAALYADAGDGDSFGAVTNLVSGDTAVLSLNAAGLAAVNAARGSTITFGLVNATLVPGTRDLIFSNSGSSLPRTLTLNNVPQPVVTGVSPTRGAITGGEPIVISGSNLGSATSVTIGGQSATITANTANSITVVLPTTATPGPADVIVTTAGGESDNTVADDFLYIVEVPTLSEWAMILLGMLLAGAAALQLHRRRTT